MKPLGKPLLPPPSSSFGTRQRCQLPSAFSTFLSRLRTSANQIQGRNQLLARLLVSGRPHLERHNIAITVSDLVHLFLLLLVIHVVPDHEISLRHLVEIILHAIKITLVISLWLKKVPSRIADDYQDSESSSRRKMAFPEFMGKDEQMLKVEHQPQLIIAKCPVPAGDFKKYYARTQQSGKGMSSDVAMHQLTIGVQCSKILESQILNDLSVQTPCILASCTDLNIPLAASYMPASDVQEMTSEDVLRMNTEDVLGVTSEDVQGTTSKDVQGVNAEDVLGMNADVQGRNADVLGMTSEDVLGMTSEDVQGMTSKDVQGMNADVHGMNADAQGMTSEDVQGMNADVQGMTSKDVQGVNAEDVLGMTSEDVLGVTSEDVLGVTSKDVQGVNAEDVQGMNADVLGMNAEDVLGMNAEDVLGVNTENVQGMNAEDVQGVTSEDVQGMNADVQGTPTNNLKETRTNDMIINQQEQPPDHEGRTSADWPQNSTDFQISRIVTTFEESLERVKTSKPKQWKKTWRSLAKNSLIPYYPHKKNSDRKQKKFQKMVHELTTFQELARKGTVKDALRKQWMSMRFSPRVEEQVYLCEGPQNGRHKDMQMEDCRLASFSEYAAVPPSGVWVTRLAAAGFFCPDQRSSVLRCAFCGVEEEINSFRHKTPMEAHRSLSPSCPMVKGEAPNKSMEEQRQKMSLQYTKAFFASRADAVHQEKRPPSSDSRDRKELRGPAVQFSGAASPQLMSSGQSPKPSSQSHPRHNLAPAATSSSHEPRRDHHHRQSSGSPPHQSSASTNASGGAQPAVLTSTPSLLTSPGAGWQSTAHQSVPPAHPTGQTRPQTRGHSPAQQHTQAGPPQTSQHLPGQHESHSERSRETTPFQTARHIETDAERSEPNASPNTDAATSSSSAAATASSEQSSSSSSPSTNESVRQLVTYAQLGIYTQEPKRPELAIAGARINSFSNWDHCSTHPPEDMAEAGFYFVGVEDLVRCFYCKGGLKSWSRSLRPWVEHARFYPKCPFVGQVKGQEFIEVVQELNSRHQGDISNAQVDQELQKRQQAEPEQGAPSGQGSSEEDKAKEQTPLGAAGRRPGGRAKMYPIALAGAKGDVVEDEAQLEKVADKLENENVEIKNERICKICQVEDVSILFLPCGHLVSCSQCAPALRTCAVCRQKVKGRVRVLADKAAIWPKDEDDCGEQPLSRSTMSGQ